MAADDILARTVEIPTFYPSMRESVQTKHEGQRTYINMSHCNSRSYPENLFWIREHRYVSGFQPRHCHRTRAQNSGYLSLVSDQNSEDKSP
jgi:hypothetical protein